MAECFLVQSGGAPLNFKIVPNPMPSTAKENTIWVDTDKINNYYFSATQPENMAEYDVWFTVGTSSPVAFSATKKNLIMVYPLSAKQYVSGAWVDKIAKIYQAGAWVELITDIYIIKQSENTEDITGGWNGQPVTMNSDGTTRFYRPASGGQYCTSTVKSIDVTDFTSMVIVVTYAHTTTSDKTRLIGLSVDGGYPSATITVDGAGTYILDISSLKGEYYPAVFMAVGNTVDVSDMILKR